MSEEERLNLSREAGRDLTFDEAAKFRRRKLIEDALRRRLELTNTNGWFEAEG